MSVEKSLENRVPRLFGFKITRYYTFSTPSEIDMETRICRRCLKEKPIEEFPLRNQYTQRRQSQCKECALEMGREWYENNKEYQKANAKKHMTEYRQNLREFVYEYLLTHPCVGPDGKGCPYNEKDPAVLEFHHVGEKTADVAVIVGRGSSLERLKAEIENCVVVCRNCHARITAQERGFFRK